MKRVLFLIITFICITYHLFASTNNDYILCINSYTDAYPWSNRVIYQLTEYAQTQHNLSISVEHIQMLLVRNQKDLEGFKENLIETYGSSRPRALVLLGSPAYTLRDTYRELWGDIPIILYSACDYIGDKEYYFDEYPIPEEKRIPIANLSNEYNTTLFYTNLFLDESIAYIKERYPTIEKLILIRDTRQINEDIESDLQKLINQEYPSIELQSFTPIQINSYQLLNILNHVDPHKTAILFTSWFYIAKTNRGESIVSNTNLLISTCKNPIFTLNLGDITTFGGGMHSGFSYDFELFKNRFINTLDQIVKHNTQPRYINFFYPTEGRPYALCNIAFARGLDYADFPRNTHFINPPPSLFERYKSWVLAAIFIITSSALFFFFRLRLFKAKESVSKLLLTKQEQLIRELNMALKSASTIRWRRDESTGEVFMVNHSMNEVNISIDKSFKLVNTEEDAIRLKDFLKNLSDQKIQSIIIHHKTPWDDTYKPYEISALAVRNSSGELTQAAYGVCRDISETYYFQQQLTEKVELLETIKESMPIGLSIFNREGALESNNKAISQFLGVNTSLLSSSLNEFLGTKNMTVLIESLKKGETFSVQRSYRDIKEAISHGIDPALPHGENFEFRCTPIINSIGEVKGYVSICIDNTQDKLIQEELRVAKEKAEDSGKLKTAFLANMSHEIRTPLNAIVGFSELLQTTEEEEDRAEYMRIINTNNELLLQLIGDILDLSKIESGMVELRLERFDFSSFFNESYATLKPRSEKSEVKLLIENPFSKCLVTLDKNRCLQLLTNYLNNAVKFTSSGYIKMGYDYAEGGLVIFVEDSGIGISEEKQDKLFQRFGKLDDFAQGTGLGLSICKAIAETMNGKVGVKSEAGKGSIFWAWIPCKAEIDREERTDTLSQKGVKETNSPSTNNELLHYSGKNILIAEDNDSNYKLVSAILKDFNLTRAINGEEAVKLTKQHKYDLILMDIRMPKMGGLEATRKIREFDKESVIIALTANAFDSDKVDAIAAGCTDFIAKPIKRKELASVISSTRFNKKRIETNKVVGK